MNARKYGERRMNNGREMEVIPYDGDRQATYEAINALREAEGMPADAVCAHCDRSDQTYRPGGLHCDCGRDGLWVPVEWVPILKLTYPTT